METLKDESVDLSVDWVIKATIDRRKASHIAFMVSYLMMEMAGAHWDTDNSDEVFDVFRFYRPRNSDHPYDWFKFAGYRLKMLGYDIEFFKEDAKTRNFLPVTLNPEPDWQALEDDERRDETELFQWLKMSATTDLEKKLKNWSCANS